MNYQKIIDHSTKSTVMCTTGAFCLVAAPQMMIWAEAIRGRISNDDLCEKQRRMFELGFRTVEILRSKGEYWLRNLSNLGDTFPVERISYPTLQLAAQAALEWWADDPKYREVVFRSYLVDMEDGS